MRRGRAARCRWPSAGCWPPRRWPRAAPSPTPQAGPQPAPAPPTDAAPAVRDARDARAADPCALPTSAQLATLGITGSGARVTAPEGPRCEWRGRPELGITLYTSGGGIATLARNSEPTTVPGPARRLPGPGDVHRQGRVLPVRRGGGGDPGGERLAGGRLPGLVHGTAGRAARRRGEPPRAGRRLEALNVVTAAGRCPRGRVAGKSPAAPGNGPRPPSGPRRASGSDPMTASGRGP